MYDHTRETLYLLGSRAGSTFPLTKVIADTRGIKVCGLSDSHKGQYVHAERYAEGAFGQLDRTQGHLHFRDSRAVASWQDEAYADAGARAGTRGGCSSTPPLDDLSGYLPLVTLGFSLHSIAGGSVKQRYRRARCLAVDLDEYPHDFLQVEVLLEGFGSKGLFSTFERGNVWKEALFDEKEPHIIFDVKAGQ